MRGKDHEEGQWLDDVKERRGPSSNDSWRKPEDRASCGKRVSRVAPTHRIVKGFKNQVHVSQGWPIKIPKNPEILEVGPDQAGSIRKSSLGTLEIPRVSKVKWGQGSG